MRSTIAAGLMSLFATAALADPYGFWALSVAPDGIKAGVIFPDFSPSDFAGMSLNCVPGTNIVGISVDSAKHLSSGARAKVVISVDDARATYQGRVELSEMDDQARVVFQTTLADPILASLSAAAKIEFAINGNFQELPVTSSKTVVAEFLKKCQS